MTRSLRTGVFPLGAVIALAFLFVLPGTGSAAPINFETTITADGTVQTFAGAFNTDNEVALIRFVLGEGDFSFGANTTSYAALPVGGFDPVLSLYFAPTEQTPLSEYSLFTYVGADGGVFPAIFDDQDLDAGLWDSSLALTLSSAGAYILALSQTGNFPHEIFSFDWDTEAPCGIDAACPPPEGRDLSFSVSTQLTPVVTTPTPVPEPGTLSLLALSFVAAARLRRRWRAAVTTRQ